MSSPAVLAAALLAWYDERARDLPWRRTSDPYAIWVSEIMLQQTQVKTVIPYFERWMARFPTPRALAEAPADDVLKAWEGLGYYSRARHLQAAARQLCEHHEDTMPTTWDAVRRLPGIGDYTAGAILSIAFGQAEPAVDGNVLRVMSRVLLLREDVTRPATRRTIAARVRESLMVCGRPGDLNQAFMDLGATVCTPSSPRCDVCPLAAHCRAWAAGEAESLPVKAGQRPPREVVLGALLASRGDAVLLVRRPSRGIWGGLWAPPAVELPGVAPAEAPGAGEALQQALAAEGWDVAVGGVEAVLQHTLTHRCLTIPLFRATRLTPPPDAATWVAEADLAEVALPVPFARYLRGQDWGPLFRLNPSPGL